MVLDACQEKVRTTTSAYPLWTLWHEVGTPGTDPHLHQHCPDRSTATCGELGALSAHSGSVPWTVLWTVSPGPALDRPTCADRSAGAMSGFSASARSDEPHSAAP